MMFKHLILRSFIVSVAVCVHSLAVFAADWKMFHGTDAENTSTETGLLSKWEPDGPPLFWVAENIGDGLAGYSSVTIADEKILTAGNLDAKTVVYCLEESTGKTIWRYENGPGWTDGGLFPGARSTPTIDGDRVYDLSPFGHLVCLDLNTGDLRWQRNILTDFEAQNITWGLAESVLIDGDRLICTPGGTKGTVVALNKMTGETVWASTGTPDHKTGYTTPRIIEKDGLRILLTMDGEGLLGVRAENGTFLFHVPHRQYSFVNVTTPLLRNDLLLISAANAGPNPNAGTRLLKLHVGKNINTKKDTADKDTTDGTGVTVDLVWRVDTFDNLYNSLHWIDGHVYGSTFGYKGGTMACIRVTDGEVLWFDRSVGPCVTTFADGKFYWVAEKSRTVYLVEPALEECRIISQFRLPDRGEGSIWAHPVVCNKKLYIRHGQFLYCYDIAAK